MVLTDDYDPVIIAARVVAGAVLGAVLAAMPDGLTSGFDGADFDRLDEALRLLQEGLSP